MLVAGDALIHALVRLGLFSTDVNDQSAWAGLYNNFRILFHIEMSAVACPWKARVKTENPLGEHAHSDFTINIFIDNNINRSSLVNQSCLRKGTVHPKSFHPHTPVQIFIIISFLCET